jgi:acyl carrier protein
MTEPEIYEALKPIFADLFGRDDIVLAPGITAEDVDGWDSYRQVELLLAVQERFGLRFSSREIDRMRRLGDLVAVVAAKSA